MRNPETINNEIRDLDVSIAELEAESLTLAARENITPGEAQRFEQVTVAVERKQRTRADLGHRSR